VSKEEGEDIMSFVRNHWAKISTALLVATIAATGIIATQRAGGEDCCAQRSACCKPGAPCCHGQGGAHAAR
jgi:hypothetical protein